MKHNKRRKAEGNRRFRKFDASYKLFMLGRADVYLGILALALGLAWVLLPSSWTQGKPFLLLILGALGLLFWVVYLSLWIFRPVWRDWTLVRGNIILKILCGVYLTPFLLASICYLVFPDMSSKEFDRSLDEQVAERMDVTKDKTADCRRVESKEQVAECLEVTRDTVGASGLGWTELPAGKGMPKGLELLPQCVEEEETVVPKDTQSSDFNSDSLFLSIYYNYIDPGSQLSASSKRGRLLSGLIAILGVLLLNGLFVSTLISWFDRRRDDWHNGEVRYKLPYLFFSRKRFVIVGGNDMAFGIVKKIFEEHPGSYVVIQTSSDVEDFRRRLFSFLTEDECLNVIIYYGNRTSNEDLNDLMLEKAEELYILGENTEQDDKGSYHDTLNMECLKLVSRYLEVLLQEEGHSMKREWHPLTCYVMFEFQSTFSMFQFSEISNTIKKYLDFKPFNSYEMWAQKVLICKELKDFSKVPYLPLEGGGISADSDDFVHLVIVGMSRMGVALAVEAAHLAHYPNFVTRKRRTRITLIDHQMEEEIDFFKSRFDALFNLARHRYVETEYQPIGKYRYVQARDKYDAVEVTDKHIYNSSEEADWVNPLRDCMPEGLPSKNYLGEDFIDTEWEFIKGSVEGLEVQQYLIDAASNKHARLTVAVCLPESNKAIAAAIYLPRKVFANALQVLIYQRTNDSLIANLTASKYDTPYNGKLRSFGMLSETFDSSIMTEGGEIADLFNDRYNEIAGYPTDGFSMASSRVKELLNASPLDEKRLMEALLAKLEVLEKEAGQNGMLDEEDFRLGLQQTKDSLVAGRVGDFRQLDEVLNGLYGTIRQKVSERYVELCSTLMATEEGAETAGRMKAWDENWIQTVQKDRAFMERVETKRRDLMQHMKEANRVKKEENLSKVLDKTAVSKWWSNVYSGNMLWTKLRSIGYNGSEFTHEQLRLLADVEHNRWNVEQLLMAYRPATPEEQYLFVMSSRNRVTMEVRYKELDRHFRQLFGQCKAQLAEDQKRLDVLCAKKRKDEAAIRALKDSMEQCREQLLAYENEQVEQMKDFLDYKKVLKNAMTHGNICSCDRLRVIDQTYKFDVGFSEYIPTVYRKILSRYEKEKSPVK